MADAVDRIVLKVTPWFLIRGVAMLAMFGVFAVWFLYDRRWVTRGKTWPS